MLGGGSLALKDVANENAKQVEALRPFDPIEVAATFGGLLTMPELQSNCVRLEVLAHLAVAYCQGHKKPPTKEVSRWFFEFGSSTAGRMEDPAEDVFVSNIASSRGNFRVIDGIWESAGFYLQRIINVVEGMPAGGDYDTLRSHVYTLLALSDLACERAKLTRYQLGNQNPETSLSAKQANSLNARRRRVCFETDDLKARGISIENLGVFIFNLAEAVKLRDEFSWELDTRALSAPSARGRIVPRPAYGDQCHHPSLRDRANDCGRDAVCASECSCARVRRGFCQYPVVGRQKGRSY